MIPLRALFLLIAVVLIAVPVLSRSGALTPVGSAWYLVGAALVLSVLGSIGVRLPGTAISGASGPSTRGRRVFGGILLLAGIALWAWAPRALLQSWPDYFDAGWSAWLIGTCLVAAGLDLMWARWQRPPGGGRWWWAALVVLLAVAALYRFGTFWFFPGESHVTQVEELQVGAMGTMYLTGWRHRWEYLSHAWLAALGIWFGGPNLFAMRVPFIVLSVLKTIPLFLWLRFAAGNTAAVVGATLMAVSAWDVTYARSPTNQNTLIVATTFALLAGPAARGRPSAFAWMGLFGGYTLYEYVGYRLVGVFAVAGGFLASVRAGGRWAGRLLRPAVTVAMILVMATTLYLHLTRTGQMYQYYDGWGRARANRADYRPEDPLAQTALHIGERSLQAASLFFFTGDQSPVRNLEGEPMVDLATAILLVLGIGYGIANPLRHLGGLTVAAFGMTIGGTLVATGNFDPIRAGGTVPFVYGLAGYGAASLLETLTAAWGVAGRRAAIALLGLALLYSWADNTRFLRKFVESPLIRQNQFRDIAYLSGWVGRNALPGEHVLAIAPGNSYLFEGNDAIWMRGDSPGTAAWDVATALETWKTSKQPTLFMVYAGAATPAVQRYLAQVLPTLPLELVPGPKGPESDIAFAHLPAPPSDLDERLAAAALCPGAEQVYRILDEEDGELARDTAVLPFLERCTWPHRQLSEAWRQQAKTKEIRVQWNADFHIEEGGAYVFFAELAPGAGELFIDRERVESTSGTPLTLAPGMHRLELRGLYPGKGSLPSVQLMWQGPDTKDVKELMPLYRLGPSPDCRSTSAAAAVPGPARDGGGS